MEAAEAASNRCPKVAKQGCWGHCRPAGAESIHVAGRTTLVMQASQHGSPFQRRFQHGCCLAAVPASGSQVPEQCALNAPGCQMRVLLRQAGKGFVCRGKAVCLLSRRCPPPGRMCCCIELLHPLSVNQPLLSLYDLRRRCHVKCHQTQAGQCTGNWSGWQMSAVLPRGTRFLATLAGQCKALHHGRKGR